MASCAHVPPPKSQDSDLHRPVAWCPGADVLRALSWAHVRVWGAAGRGCHTPAWLGSARFARSSYVNRALFGISTSADPCCSLQRLPRRTTVSHDRARKACNASKAAIGPTRVSKLTSKPGVHRCPSPWTRNDFRVELRTASESSTTRRVGCFQPSMIATSPSCAEPAAQKLSKRTLHSHDHTRTLTPARLN